MNPRLLSSLPVLATSNLNFKLLIIFSIMLTCAGLSVVHGTILLTRMSPQGTFINIYKSNNNNNMMMMMMIMMMMTMMMIKELS